MMENITLRVTSSLRVIWACALKEIQMALADLRPTLFGALRPILFLAVMSLLALSGGLDPAAVVMNDTGPYAQQFYTALASAHSFQLQKAGAQEAHDLLESGKILAVVTIPADFDSAMRQGQAVEMPLQIDNIESDLTQDIQRALPLSITLFYGKAFPHVVTVTAQEHDLQAQDTGFISYLMVAVLVLALMAAGLMQAGGPAAREWENATIKELLLSPASRSAIVLGKILGALVVSLLSAAVTLALIILVVGVWPAHFWEMIGVTLLTMLSFIALGILLSALIKEYRALTLVVFASVLPLFVLSGPFGPLSFLKMPVIQAIAQLFPVYYAIVLEQHAFHGFNLNTYGAGLNAAILGGYTIILVVAASLLFQRSTRVK
jgi:ABC-type transport system involved in multi-copper enzyme maturation permease subunit